MTTTSSPAAAPLAALVLLVHLCAERRTYRVTFAAGLDAVAAAFVTARASYAAIITDDEAADLTAWPLLAEALDPTCEHGMSSRNCYGPDHFMSAVQERELCYS